MIKVNEKQIPFTPGMTAADALKAAGESPGAMTLVVVDGKVVPRDRLDMEPLADGAHIKLLTIVSGG
ncbi:sulfur carrier protein ThiS [Desulfallas thermosapovorans]|uniref:Thiamine biosynthesis protein ThiS n=1 Tax=Desulfallas thermosapovorans DSM 6562 TaxID=1121431 RepID=A0A5S4ZUR8_9FIRM|nr:sulfur carrier protein ThiS [Desulfallas thermosapovorans]TYO96455.1 thiamine biosynthesis protein ThiS [Desulfallas thermosapovorans DSM 6562]